MSTIKPRTKNKTAYVQEQTDGPPSNLYCTYLKRVFDIVAALAGLTITLPLWGFIAICVYLEDRGPVLFSLEVCGKGNSTFRQLKFRTMSPEEDHDVDCRKQDKRVTCTGSILRPLCLDELPQLLNILKGDMSLVGPRPIHWDETPPEFDSLEDVPGYNTRKQIKPGLAGLAQIRSDKFTSPDKKFRYDRLYVHNISFLLDVKLLVLSIYTALTREGETPDDSC